MATRFVARRGRQQRLPLTRNTVGNISRVPVERLSISFEQDLADRVRARAAHEDTPISAWLAEAAERRLRTDGLRAVIADWEAEHGEITEAELEASRARLGIRRPGDPS